MDNKRKIENEELRRESKSAIQVKEEIATLKCEVCATLINGYFSRLSVKTLQDFKCEWEKPANY